MEIMKFEDQWMGLENIILSEVTNIRPRKTNVTCATLSGSLDVLFYREYLQNSENQRGIGREQEKDLKVRRMVGHR